MFSHDIGYLGRAPLEWNSQRFMACSLQLHSSAYCISSPYSDRGIGEGGERGLMSEWQMEKDNAREFLHLMDYIEC